MPYLLIRLTQTRLKKQMISIVKATENDFMLLADLGKRTFIESHGRSASQRDIDIYTDQKYSPSAMLAELESTENIYHIICKEGQPVGYSKIILNATHPNIELANVTKLERLYLLRDVYNMNIGSTLFHFNVELSKAYDQTGMWLFVWKENSAAVKFYLKHNFNIIGSHDFPISETHSNPNHQMLVRY
jgi:diamine N-acetyltransferase